MMVTAGYSNREPLKKLYGLIDAAQTDLKFFDDAMYRKITTATLQPVLDGLILAKEMGVWLEITNLIIPDWTDNLDDIRNLCKWLSDNGFKNTPLHLSRFYPMHKLEQLPPTPVEILNNAYRIAKEEGLKYVYTGNAPGNEISDTKCPSCNSAVVVRQGYRIAANNISGGKCSKCGAIIEGVWN